MATIGDLVANLAVNARPFMSGLNKSRGALSSFASYAKTAFIGIATASAAAGAGIGVMAVKMAASAEQTKISFEVMTGSAERAGKLISDLRRMGAATPFEFSDLANSTKTLLSFGRTADDVLTDLDMLSNIASGDAQKLSSLSLVFGQIAANSRMTGGDLLQLVNTGFNPLNQIAAKTGETMTELRNRMSKGKIGFEEVRQAFKDATSAGGLFYQMNEKQSKTLAGRFSTMKDEITSSLILIGEALVENLDLNALTVQITEFATTFKENWVPAIANALENILPFIARLELGFQRISKQIDVQIESFNRFKSDAKATFDFVKKPFVLLGKEIASAKSDVDRLKRIASENINQSLQRFGLGTPAPAVEPGGGIGVVLDQFASQFRDSVSQFKDGVKLLDAELTSQFKEKEWMDSLLDERIRDAKKGEAARDFDIAKAAEKQKNQSERMLAGFIRDGIAAVGSGLMSLGPPVKSVGKPTNQVGVMEKGSQEAFETMRANVGAGGKDKTQEKQLAEAQKQTKILGKLEKKMTGPEMAKLQLQIMGIED